MTDFFAFTESLLGSISAFLLSEPIVWFVGVFLVVAVATLVKRIIN